jgi:hypothetical protein
MDVASIAITHFSHRTSSNVHIFICNSICVSPLGSTLCAERSELGFSLGSISRRRVCMSHWKTLFPLICFFSFFCLHPRGRQRIPSSRKARSTVEMDCSDIYFTHIDGAKRGAALGFGDFLLYNLMILLALPAPPSSSMITQLWIPGGSIISIIIGLLITEQLLTTYQLQVAPGLPLPVMIFTAYVILLQFIVDRC